MKNFNYQHQQNIIKFVAINLGNGFSTSNDNLLKSSIRRMFIESPCTFALSGKDSFHGSNKTSCSSTNRGLLQHHGDSSGGVYVKLISLFYSLICFKFFVSILKKICLQCVTYSLKSFDLDYAFLFPIPIPKLFSLTCAICNSF